MNLRLRQRFGLSEMFVQPTANDAGCAGRGLGGHFEITGDAQPMVMEHAYWTRVQLGGRPRWTSLAFTPSSATISLKTRLRSSQAAESSAGFKVGLSLALARSAPARS